jgi:hypothetical protein
MRKDHDALARRPPDDSSVSTSVGKTKHPRSRPSSTRTREIAMGRGLASSSRGRRGKVGQDLIVLAPSLGRSAALAFRHLRFERFRAALTDAQQLVHKHPVQAMLVGLGIGYLLSRTKRM